MISNSMLSKRAVGALAPSPSAEPGRVYLASSEPAQPPPPPLSSAAGGGRERTTVVYPARRRAHGTQQRMSLVHTRRAREPKARIAPTYGTASSPRTPR
mmetsp:Transcript_5859/g.15006  ORF Transcript_5859/g.15006 Transcript_5859/m.15006 type:complete len:99 (-) Transcript_5859:67-363(-)